MVEKFNAVINILAISSYHIFKNDALDYINDALFTGHLDVLSEYDELNSLK